MAATPAVPRVRMARRRETRVTAPRVTALIDRFSNSFSFDTYERHPGGKWPGDTAR
jgi:hypothetical protein